MHIVVGAQQTDQFNRAFTPKRKTRLRLPAKYLSRQKCAYAGACFQAFEEEDVCCCIAIPV